MKHRICRVAQVALGPLLFLPITAPAQTGTDTTEVVDSLLLRQIQDELGESDSQESEPQTTRPLRLTNPEISAIGDLRASYETPAERHFDFEFHEAEFALKSVVDPYVRADFFLNVHPEEGEWHIELEEAYLVTLSLPASLQLKAGQFRSQFGRINRVHPHALPFIAIPNVSVNYLGEEGIRDVGVSLSWLVPNPFDFFQELTFEFTGGPSEGASFVKNEKDRFLYLAHLLNFWDLTQNATLQLGLTGVAGPNDVAGTTFLGGVDITYKWKPLKLGAYHSFVLQGEAVYSSRKDPSALTMNSWGMYFLASYQASQRLFLTGRFDYSNLPESSSRVERALTGTIGWLATEFQKLELEFRSNSSNVYDSFTQISLRSVFVIGSHGAHEY